MLEFGTSFLSPRPVLNSAPSDNFALKSSGQQDLLLILWRKLLLEIARKLEKLPPEKRKALETLFGVDEQDTDKNS